MNELRTLLAVSCLAFFTFTSAAAETHAIEAESAEHIGGASTLTDGGASGRGLVQLAGPGQAIKLTDVPAASKLAIRYASVTNGTISITVNDQPARKVNVHSSGPLTNSFLNAFLDLAIPANATLTLSVATNDIALSVDRITVGDGDLGLPPDIWYLPPLTVAPGPYSADWKAMSRVYLVPEWWRDAKFGAWAHWGPQSVPRWKAMLAKMPPYLLELDDALKEWA